MQKSSEKDDLAMSDVIEDDIRTQMPHILEILLIDRTTSSPKASRNILWANDNYKEYDADPYSATAQIRPELITGKRGKLIMPRALKAAALSYLGTKQKRIFSMLCEFLLKVLRISAFSWRKSFTYPFYEHMPKLHGWPWLASKLVVNCLQLTPDFTM